MIVYRSFFVSLLVCIFAYNALTQVGVTESDPESTRILESVKSNYEGFETISATFTMTVEVPEKPTEIIEGSFDQKGKKYVLGLGDQQIYCNAAYVWVYTPSMNEVQVNDYFGDEEEGFSSPQDFLAIYDRKDFIHALQHSGNENGIPVYQIEFKPTERNSDYTKVRATIHQKTKEVMKVKVFERTGIRFTFEVDDFKSNVNLGSDHFQFQIDNYPDIVVEDLRLD